MIKKVKDEVKEKGYSQYSNEIHYNKDLSSQAKYLFLLILSLPDTYSISIKSLSAITGEGEKKVKNSLEKLIEAGYLVLETEQCRDEKGRLARGFNCEIYELPELNPAFSTPKTDEETNDTVPTKGQHGQKAVTAKGSHINKITIQEKLKEKNKIISPSSENEMNEEKKPQPLAEEKTFAKLTVLLNNTCGVEGAERVTTAILKKYGNMSLELLEKAIELAIKKDIKDVKKLKGYILETLSDWSCRGFTTVEEVEELFRKFKNSKKVIREEMKPDWLNKPQQSYDPDRKYTSEELEIIEQMKAMGKGFIPVLPAQSFVDDSLPF